VTSQCSWSITSWIIGSIPTD